MKTLLKSTVAAAALVLPSLALATTYELDPQHTAADFTVRHMMVSNVRGEFGKVTGTLNLDDKDITKSTVEVTIDANSINTREPKRDAHLKSADFFDVAKYPALTFKSTKVEKAGDNKLKVTGDLTMHGVTKTVVLDVDGPSKEMKDPGGNMRIGAGATTKVNRKDYGLMWNMALESGGVLVGDEVTINLSMEAVKKAPAAAPAPKK
jgi:polyisoprenoid-binding protein YceI